MKLFIVKQTIHTAVKNVDNAFGPFRNMQGAELWAAAQWGDDGSWYVLPLEEPVGAYQKKLNLPIYQ